MVFKQNYIIDEGHRIPKGPNSTISLIHHYLTLNVPQNTSVIFYSDNCPGQNKNQYLIGFFAYLVKVLKLYSSIKIFFMVVGHTKFSPDSHFGTIKSYLKRGECQSILQMIGPNGIVRNSAINNIEIANKTPNEVRPNWIWRDWKGFLKNKFRKCTGISNWHVIKIFPEGLYIQVAEKFGDALANFRIMKDDAVFFEEEPSSINPEGISPSRLECLAYFKDFVDEEHKHYIASNY